MATIDPSVRPRVVIVGAGFGGLAAAKALARTPAEVVLIDRRNYHLFQPLLYQVATAALSPADIAWPIRSIFSRQANVAVQMGKVAGVDARGREVILDERRLAYDYLVLATGARHSYFGRDEWESVAPGLKKIAGATAIRERVLLAFERAEVTDDPAERRRLLTFVIVGGGPTGVEMAGAIVELARMALAADFHTPHEPPPPKWSALRYGFGPRGGPRCRARGTRPRRSSPSCARWTSWPRKAKASPTPCGRSA
jgi:NADH:ubiquinone reductase (H+-translocating)